MEFTICPGILLSRKSFAIRFPDKPPAPAYPPIVNKTSFVSELISLIYLVCCPDFRLPFNISISLC